MKKLILFFLLIFPSLIFAEYNGVHIKFEILLNNESTIYGYKYVAHGTNTEDFKKHLESNYEVFLKNQFTSEPGIYGYYQKRLKYSRQGFTIYKLIEPAEINIDKVKSVSIKELITATYATQIIGDYHWEDRHWMSSKPITQYSESDEMCDSDTFIHGLGNVSNEVIEQIKSIIEQTNAKLTIREKEIENAINSDLEYYEKTRDLYDERDQLLKPILEKYKNIKTITIRTCTC